MTKSAERTRPEATGAEDLTSAMMAVNPVAAKAWIDIMSESARFVADRLREDLDTQKAILECKSPEDLLEVQSHFIGKAMKQYSEEAARLYGMMTEAAKDIAEDAAAGRARGYDDVPV